jgi:hypothetical protein
VGQRRHRESPLDDRPPAKSLLDYRIIGTGLVSEDYLPIEIVRHFLSGCTDCTATSLVTASSHPRQSMRYPRRLASFFPWLAIPCLQCCYIAFRIVFSYARSDHPNSVRIRTTDIYSTSPKYTKSTIPNTIQYQRSPPNAPFAKPSSVHPQDLRDCPWRKKKKKRTIAGGIGHHPKYGQRPKRKASPSAYSGKMPCSSRCRTKRQMA